MNIILVLIFIILVILVKNKYDLIQIIGKIIFDKIPLNLKINNYKTIKNLRFLNSKEEYRKVYNQFIYKKIFYSIISFSIFCYSLKYHGKIEGVFWCYIITFIVTIYFLPDIKLYEETKKNRENLKLVLPNFLTKLSLLMGSGMSSSNSIRKIVRSKENLLEIVILNTLNHIDSGYSFEESYYELSQQCQNNNITQFVRTILQDKHFGSKVTLERLETICNEVWKNKKIDILKKGEEASTKLLIPMMISLISVLLAVVIPSIYELFKMNQ